jgi:hypothetical protein
LSGRQMEFLYPEERYLDGSPVNLYEGRLFDSVYLQADTGSERLTMRYGNMVRILNFQTLEIINEHLEKE